MLWTLVCFFALRTLAIPYPSPSETPAGYGGGGGGGDGDAALAWAPLPTAAPRELFRRDAANNCGWMVGDDNTTTSMPCDNDGYTCFRETALKAIGCCRNSDAGFSSCRIHTKCMHAVQTCLDACMENPLIKKCSDPTPSCGTWFWDNGESSFECDSVTFEDNVFSPRKGTLPIKPAPATTSSATEPSAPQAPPPGAYASDVGGAPASNNTSNNTGNHTGKNTAVIGGAAGGGALVLLVIVAVVVYIWRRPPPPPVPVEMPTDVNHAEVPAGRYSPVMPTLTPQEKGERAELPSHTN